MTSNVSMQTDSVVAHLALGSNLGDRESTLLSAVDAIEALDGCAVIAMSSLWQTEPLYIEDQPEFLNACIAVETSLTPAQTLGRIAAIEADHGRVRAVKNGPRKLDIDILIWGDAVVNEPDLSIPHPGIAERAFVLAPLGEIAAEVVHPVLKESIADLRDRVPGVDRVSVYRSRAWKSVVQMRSGGSRKHLS